MSGKSKISDFTYIEDLHLVRFIKGTAELFYLSKDYSVLFTYNNQVIKYAVPAGAKTDFASIPSIVPNWVLTKLDRHLEAAVVHDHMCVARNYTSKEAADVFDAALAAAEVPTWKRVIMVKAVRLFGPQW